MLSGRSARVIKVLIYQGRRNVNCLNTAMYKHDQGESATNRLLLKSGCVGAAHSHILNLSIFMHFISHFFEAIGRQTVRQTPAATGRVPAANGRG